MKLLAIFIQTIKCAPSALTLSMVVAIFAVEGLDGHKRRKRVVLVVIEHRKRLGASPFAVQVQNKGLN